MQIAKDISEFIAKTVSYKDFTAEPFTISHALHLGIILGIVIILWIFLTGGVSKVKEPWWTKFPGPRPLPIIGNAFRFAVPDYEIIGAIKSFMEYGDVVLGWLGNQPYLFLKDPDAIEKVLSSNAHIDKSPEYHCFTSWLGTGLLTSKGIKWHGRRKLLTPAFHFKILDHFIEIFNEQTQILVECLNEKASTGEVFNIYPYVTRCALDIICETAMGEKIQAQRNSESEYVKAVYEITELLLKRITWPHLRSDFLWLLFNYRKREKQLLSVLHGFTEQVIQKRKAERKLEGNEVNEEDPDSNPFGKRRRAFLDLLLNASDNGRLMSDLDIREETDTFMFEGHDTTAASLNFTIFLLACNPECQKKVHEELADIFGEDWDRFITTEDLSRMKYLECCIKESLRIFPSVPFIGRQTTKEMNLGNKRIVPKGTVIWITTHFMHRDPRIYTEPDRFLPERFASENVDEIRKHPFAYIPFSAGPRNCIGQKFAQLEEKLALAQFFRNFKVEPREKLEDLKLVPELILRPKNGLLVSISKLRQ